MHAYVAMYGHAMATITERHALETIALLTFGSAFPLLTRMRREVDETGHLSASTVVWMYSTYTAHAATTAAALRQARPPRRRLASRLVTGVGCCVASAGVGLVAAGMSRFGGPRQVSGMNDDQLAASGVYRWSRNPQYVGYVALLIGLSTARRSPLAAVLAAGAAGAFAWWVPVEERHLRQTYGESYRQYTQQAPRWLPLPTAA